MYGKKILCVNANISNLSHTTSCMFDERKAVTSYWFSSITLIIGIIALEQQCAHIFGSKDTFYVCVNISNVGHTTSDSSMFDEREAGDRWDNPGQAAVYWALYSPVYSAVYCCILEPASATTLRKPDAIFLSEFLIQPLSFDTSGTTEMDLYVMDLWETVHN